MEAHGVAVGPGEAGLLVGTMKGAFLLTPDGEMAGPWFPGHSVYAMAHDGRAGRRRLWAATSSMHWGAVLCWSDDLGATWHEPEKANVRFPDGAGQDLKQIWQLVPGRTDEPDTLWCGVDPAALFVSRDNGATWSLVEGLHDHPHRARWEPGGGGKCLHTIVVDSGARDRMLIAISTGGVYRTDDGGRTWQARNRGIRADFLPDKSSPEFGQCVHKVVQNPARPERLYLQNHGGVYRSDDGGDEWKDIGRGLPSDFGFPIAVHPHDPDTVFVLPLQSDMFRVTPEGRLRIYRSRDAGETWHALSDGLPEGLAYETVLRDALGVDTTRGANVYFGTRSGKVYRSPDGGDRWQLLVDGLPPIVCVKPFVA